MDTNPSKTEMLDCINRSGYMLESRLVARLNEAGFFVEPNQSALDDRTGKSREIDILAEFYNYKPDRARARVCVKTHFVIEVVSNLLPLVLITPRPKSPAIVPEEAYLRYMCTPSEDEESHPFLGEIDLFDLKGLDDWCVFSQYFAFTRKKADGELMASHPDDMHSSLLKMVEYTLDDVERFPRLSDDYWRLFFWQPVLVLKDNLLIFTEQAGGGADLLKVDSAKLEYNFHYRGQPKTMIVDFVTEANLIKHLMDIVQRDDSCGERLWQIRSAHSKRKRSKQ